jgi:type IV secretion system protein VirB1
MSGSTSDRRSQLLPAVSVPADAVLSDSIADRLVPGGGVVELDTADAEALGAFEEAAKITEQYIARGYSVDLGLMQVNSRNLAALGVTIEQMLDPCTNIRGGAKILTADYVAAARTRGEGQRALEAALSAYNTGDFYRGFVNGYVAQYYGPRSVPALGVGVPEARTTVHASHRTVASASNPYSANTSVFVREPMNVRID